MSELIPEFEVTVDTVLPVLAVVAVLVIVALYAFPGKEIKDYSLSKHEPDEISKKDAYLL